jgi:hypothetical protein
MGGANAIGIQVRSGAYNSATFASQSVAVTNNNVTALSGSNAVGIDVETRASRYGTFVTQSVRVDANTVSSIGGTAGIRVATSAFYNSTITQALAVTGNNVSGISGANAIGIDIGVTALHNSFISQTLYIGTNTVSGVNGNGIQLHVMGRYNGDITQTGSIVSNFVHNNVGTGIEVALDATNGGSNLSSYNGGPNYARGFWTMEGNSIATNFVGVNLRVYGTSSTQFVDLTTSNAANSFGNFITSNGVGVNARVTDGYQAVNLYSQLGGTGGPNRVQGNVLFNTSYSSNAGSVQNFNK